MNLWFVSFFTGIVSIIALYYSIQMKSLRLRITAVIAFSLLLMGETLDLLAEVPLNTILLLFAEMLEMFITVGFFSLVYYSHLKLNRENKRKNKRRKKN